MTEDFKDKWPEMRMKHLELLQSVIGRMGNSSANAKNYCMTMVAGLLGLSAAVSKPQMLLGVVPLVLIFSILDASYLRLERSFRSQYDQVRKDKLDQAPDFLITTGWSQNHHHHESLWSWSVFWFYSPILVTLLAVYFYLR